MFPLIPSPPPFWLSALPNLALALAARRLRWVDTAGAWVGAALGTAMLWGLGWAGFALFAAFVAGGSGVTRWGYWRKQERGTAQAQQGQRSWNHALANCGVAALCALLARGAGETGAGGHAFAASLAAALADTSGSELGALWGGRAYHPLTWRPLPPGTPGACSAAGTVCGALLAATWLSIAIWLGLIRPSSLFLILLLAMLGAWLDSVAGVVPLLRRWLRHDGRNVLATLTPALLALLLTESIVQ